MSFMAHVHNWLWAALAAFLLAVLILHLMQAVRLRRSGLRVRRFWFPVYLCVSFIGVALYKLIRNSH